MRRFDLTPLFRSSIGFDHLAAVMDQLASVDADNGFPPYNIERLGENEYRITMAVAGFSTDDLNIEVKEQTLSVRGQKKGEENDRQYLHRGIAARQFQRNFLLADGMVVKDAILRNGMLMIAVVRPRAEKIARRIEIRSA